MEKIDREFLYVFVDEAKTILLEWDRSLAAFSNSGFDEHLDVIFRLTHNLKGTSRSIGLNAFSGFTHEIETALKAYKENRQIHHSKLVPLLEDCQRFLEAWLDQLSQDPNHEPNAESLKEKLAEFSKHKRPRFQTFGRKAKKPKTSTGTSSRRDDDTQTVRVSDAKLEDLAYLLRSLTRNQIRILDMVKGNQIRNTAAKNAIQQGHHLVESMAAILEDLRVQPVQNLLMRLERVARDTARRQNKHVEVLIEGGETAIDSAIMEKISDPLGHMIRNAVDHGIEALDDRLSAGKSEIAVIRMRAISDKTNLTLEVSDDGRGIDTDRIRKMAIKRGWITKKAKLTPEQIHAFIFEQGFSTAEEITEFSGRGIGLEVVQKTLQELGGTIQLETSSKGTSFRLIIPHRHSEKAAA